MFNDVVEMLRYTSCISKMVLESSEYKCAPKGAKTLAPEVIEITRYVLCFVLQQNDNTRQYLRSIAASDMWVVSLCFQWIPIVIDDQAPIRRRITELKELLDL